MSLHPCSDSLRPHQTMKEKFIDILFKDKELLNKMRKGELFLLLYQGWELSGKILLRKQEKQTQLVATMKYLI